MSLTPEAVRGILDEHQLHDKDTGSSEVQIAVLTSRIKQLTEHLKIHSHDCNSRRGIEKMVSRRKKLLRYLKSRDVARFDSIVKSLGIRASKI